MMRKNNVITIGFITFLLVGMFQSCSKDDKNNEEEVIPSVDEYDRAVMLSNYVNSYIIPAYSAYKTELTSLKTSVDNFSATPTITSLQDLRLKWENSLLVWQDVAFLEFGPAAYIGLRSQTNLYPIDTTLVIANINSGTYNLSAASNFDAKGLQAIDYLVNGIRGTDQEIVDYFIATSNASIYIKDVANELKTNGDYVYNEWVGTYGQSFISNSASNAQGSAVSEFVNALSLHYETYVRKGKIGLPAGVFNGFSGLPMPEHVEALYYGQSLPFAYRSLSAFQKLLKGESYDSSSNGEGLDDYLSFIQAKAAGQPLEVVMDNKINEVKTELLLLNDPLSLEVVNNNQGVKNVYQKMQELVPNIKVEMTDALGVLVTYQDNDGD